MVPLRPMRLLIGSQRGAELQDQSLLLQQEREGAHIVPTMSAGLKRGQRRISVKSDRCHSRCVDHSDKPVVVLDTKLEGERQAEVVSTVRPGALDACGDRARNARELRGTFRPVARTPPQP